MKLWNKSIIYIIVFVIIVAGSFSNSVIGFYKSIIFDDNIIVLLIALIAGLFGFIVAVIPFAIQLFNQDNIAKNNIFLNKLMTKDKFNFFIKPMFNRFIKILYIMLSLFVYIFFLIILQKIPLSKILFIHKDFFYISIYQLFIMILFYLYIILIFNFLSTLRNVIRDLQTLIFYFYKSKNLGDK